MNIILLDRDYNFLDAAYSQIGIDDEQGTDLQTKDPHGHLTIKKLVTTPGYAYIFVSNENPVQVDVFFDDLTILHIKSPVVQMDDYYPFGLTYNSYSRENSIPQDHKYNGKEEQKELGLGWLDYGMRMYQPELGRFFAQDRFAEKYLELTPYHYGANNPVLYVDVNGDSIRVHFLDKKGNETGVIPQQVQSMFNSEYGIKVGYNSKTGMLYYDGEVETENKVSESAKETLVSALTDEATGSKAEKKYGNVFFGYGTFGAQGPAKGFLEGTTQGLKSGYAYIRLDNFDSKGNSTVRDYSSFDKLGIPRRAYNMGRVFEHEWMGHVMRGTGDGTNTKPGKTEELINKFRTEMGLPHRLNYSGDMYFGPAGTNVRTLIRAANRGELVPVLPFKKKG